MSVGARASAACMRTLFGGHISSSEMCVSARTSVYISWGAEKTKRGKNQEKDGRQFRDAWMHLVWGDGSLEIRKEKIS